MENYENYTDEELIVRIRDGEKEISDYLISKYKMLVRGKVNSMFILGGDKDDLIQEGMIGLYKAIRDYDFARDAAFITFADICVSRQLYTAIQSSQRKKHTPLNNYISLYGAGNQDEEDGIFLVNALSTMADRNPEEIMMDKALVDEIEEIIDNELSSLEKQVIRLFLTGMSVTDIAKTLSRDSKSTDNALQRAKQKIKKELAKRE